MTNNQVDGKDSKDKNIPECNDPEYKEELDKVKDTLNSHEETKKSEILRLAKFLEDKGYIKELVSERLAEDLKGYATARYIQMCLDPEQKQKPKVKRNGSPIADKKKPEQSTSQSQPTAEVEDNKDIEQSPKQIVSASVTGQSITDTEIQEPTQADLDQMYKDETENQSKDKKLSPEQQPRPQQQQEPNIYDGIKQKYEQEISDIKAEADKYMELLNKEKKEKRDLDNEVIKLSNQIKEERARIFQLEQKEESKPKIQNEIILSRIVLELLQTRAIPERLKTYPQTTKFQLLLQGVNEKGNEVFNLSPI